jgi:hypothetical protein
MTQDQDGPAQGTGYVVRGGVVGDPGAGDPDDQDEPDHPDTATDPHEVTAPVITAPADLAYQSLLPDAPAYRQQWQQAQFRFVDDPHGSVAAAADVIAQVTAKLEAAIAERQRSLRASWSEGAGADTETLRATLLTYRAFLDQLTGSSGSGQLADAGRAE